MSDPDDSDPWDLDDLDEAILDLDRERLGPLLAWRLPSLALMPDLDAVNFGCFSQLARIYLDTERMVFVPFSAIKAGPDGSVMVDPGMYPPEALLAQADWHASWRQREFEDYLRSSIERKWQAYYREARCTAMRCPKTAFKVSSLEADIARHLRAAARGFRQCGHEDLADLLDRLVPARPNRERRQSPMASSGGSSWTASAWSGFMAAASSLIVRRGRGRWSSSLSSCGR